MNKLTIPAILVATVMVAGIFAFMPVEQATTVHTTIIDETMQIISVDSTAADFAYTDDDELRISSSEPYQLIGVTCTNDDDTDVDASVDFADLVVTVDGSTDAAIITNANVDVDDAAVFQIWLSEGAFYASEGGTNSIVIDLGTITGEDGDELINCIVTVETKESSTVTAIWTAA